MEIKQISSTLERVALFLELQGANPFKTRAYERAARSLEAVHEDIAQLHKEGKLTEIPGIGKSIASDIAELLDTGKLRHLEEMEASFPPTIMELFRVPGLGPKKIKALYEKLGISSLGELEYACHENRLIDLDGFGAKSQENIIHNLEKVRKYRERRLRSDCEGQAALLLEKLRGHRLAIRADIAGSLRRGMETVKDIDLVVATANGPELAEWYSRQDFIESLIASGPTKVSATIADGVNVDLRLVENGQYPFALQYLTGSKNHNEELRAIAKAKGLKLNEYGLFQEGQTGSLPCDGEADIYEALGLAYIEPELREAMGELDAAREGNLPGLLEAKDIRGIFHAHTSLSDGDDDLSNMAEAAKKLGFSYLGISDHSQSASYAGGLKPDRVKKMREEVDAYNSSQNGFKVFFGIESDITSNGGLDYEEDILQLFDFVVASVHSQFSMSREEMTGRLEKALENPFTTMLGHPTGRLLLAREPYEVDMDRILKKAAETGTIIEFNANPYRLDLDWRLMPFARELGVKISVNHDAHSGQGLEDVFYGLKTARKGWLEAKDVINTMPLDAMDQWLQERKKS